MSAAARTSVDLAVLLPHLRGLHVDQVECGADDMEIEARSRSMEAACRSCGVSSSRVHSRYGRRLQDGALGGRPVVIHLIVRRFFCVNPDCLVVTFAEQPAGLSAAYRRRTVPLLGLLEQIGLALAGRAGARLAAVLGITVHWSTLLRLVRALPDPQPSTAPAVLGVDDFALRRGHVYGTILVDMATGKPIDLLEGRNADPLADWLAAHPGAEVICRDRAGAYAEGAKTGAPEAIQVADRWHLWHNLGGHVEKAVVRHRVCLTEPGADSAPPQPSPPEAEPPPGPGAPPGDSDGLRDVCGRERRLVARTRERYATVHQLLAGGESLSGICRILSLDRKTVQRFARAANVDELLVKATNRDSKLDPFKPHLHQRWDEGCTDAAALHAGLQALGWRGSVQAVRRYVRPFRQMTAAPPPPPAVPKARQITGWLLRHPDTLDPDEQANLAGIRACCPHLDTLAEHVRAFAEMLTHRHGHRLEEWLTRVEADDQPELHSFATGLRHDQQAVTAGLTLPYSSGKVEGNVNRLKALKRQMYGRAKLDLLRKRVVLTA